MVVGSNTVAVSTTRDTFYETFLFFRAAILQGICASLNVLLVFDRKSLAVKIEAFY